MRYPSDKQRIAIVGRTGSGKTIAGLHQLSYRSYDVMPWAIIDYKRDEWIAKIPYAHFVPMDFRPSVPGIYVYQPVMERDDEEIEKLFEFIADTGKIGIYVDEGYSINKRSRQWTRILTQGRSNIIPVITLSQRPVNMSRFVLSEADFLQVFHLTDKDDRQTVQRYMPEDADVVSYRLPMYWSYYFEVAANKLTVLRPVPPPEEILSVFEERLRPRMEMHDDAAPLKSRYSKAVKVL